MKDIAIRFAVSCLLLDSRPRNECDDCISFCVETVTPFNAHLKKGSDATPFTTQDLLFGDETSTPTAPTNYTFH